MMTQLPMLLLAAGVLVARCAIAVPMPMEQAHDSHSDFSSIPWLEHMQHTSFSAQQMPPVQQGNSIYQYLEHQGATEHDQHPNQFLDYHHHEWQTASSAGWPVNSSPSAGQPESAFGKPLDLPDLGQSHTTPWHPDYSNLQHHHDSFGSSEPDDHLWQPYVTTFGSEGHWNNEQFQPTQTVNDDLYHIYDHLHQTGQHQNDWQMINRNPVGALGSADRQYYALDGQGRADVQRQSAPPVPAFHDEAPAVHQQSVAGISTASPQTSFYDRLSPLVETVTPQESQYDGHLPRASSQSAIGHANPANPAAEISGSPHYIDTLPNSVPPSGHGPTSHLDAVAAWYKLDKWNDPETEEASMTKVIAASKFLQHHPQFVEIPRSQWKGLPLALPEISPNAKELKDSINKLFFSDDLKWQAKGDAMIASAHTDLAVKQFVHRLNIRGSLFVLRDLGDPETNWFQNRLVAAPHRIYKTGSTMFDTSATGHSLLFTFWVPSGDSRDTRLQYVGSASLTLEGATEVIKNAITTVRTLHVSDSSGLQGSATHFQLGDKILPPPNIEVVQVKSDPAFGSIISSKAWLKTLPVVQQVTPVDSMLRLTLSRSLTAKMHLQAETLKAAANAYLFAHKVTWHAGPGETITKDQQPGDNNVFRYHRRSTTIFVTKPELLKVVPYPMIVLPYEVPGRNARLFSADLRGVAHTFTLWASRGSSGILGNEAEVFDFVSGGSINFDDTGVAFENARALMKRLTAEAAKSH